MEILWWSKNQMDNGNQVIKKTPVNRYTSFECISPNITCYGEIKF